ncbi:hypothetical protein RISK_001042 [Rhodopirellula islandica]|uniref:Uncharacterized protein n=1 Tax=Rhodopirellula islandica TaxID=595434 RepID=A0A0J1BL32_RHOIS|nr:hypothetical protein RISK_001042 [Rhodopirellula islandica]
MRQRYKSPSRGATTVVCRPVAARSPTPAPSGALFCFS